MMIEFDEYKVKLNGLKPKLDELAASLGIERCKEDIERLHRQGADYIGCGPFRFTTTKKNLSPVLGLEGYKRIVSDMKAHGIDLPIVAIGGILKSDIADIMQTGVTGIAVSGGILNAESPTEEMKQFISLIKPNR